MTGDWLRPAEVDPAARLRLFLLPYSGAGASAYHGWAALFPADVAVQAVQLPGRQDRLAEAPYTDLAALVEALCEVLDAECDGRPYGLFGHSMGGLLAYRVAVALERDGGPAPALVAPSGWAPEGFRTVADLVDAPDAVLVNRLAELGMGVDGSPDPRPDVGYHDPAVLAVALPTIRADLAVCAGYRDDRARLRGPLVTYSGAGDPLLAPGAVASWPTRSAAYLGDRRFPGGHFFLHEHALPIATDLAYLLDQQAAAVS
ncbi:MAG: thioesterase [Actinobacteria bacterium]|nr:MAG: thioesterase [Actinomycetota bacterium]